MNRILCIGVELNGVGGRGGSLVGDGDCDCGGGGGGGGAATARKLLTFCCCLLRSGVLLFSSSSRIYTISSS